MQYVSITSIQDPFSPKCKSDMDLHFLKEKIPLKLNLVKACVHMSQTKKRKMIVNQTRHNLVGLFVIYMYVCLIKLLHH